MEAVSSSEILVPLYYSTWCDISEDCNLQRQRKRVLKMTDYTRKYLHIQTLDETFVKPEKYHVLRMEEIKFQGISKNKNEIQAHTRKTNNKKM
jgi:hypothetical protein